MNGSDFIYSNIVSGMIVQPYDLSIASTTAESSVHRLDANYFL